ncbi:hypothetical protein [Aquitalea sp. LB_tupeE]|uniref:hypothetical protein n=1 Tax=Aquitalea sp. LB_tupeE TaxID=2748078 RepID=UPI0015B7FED1|nr:hypothetical protein [Aquitalea sp. LB_tupeE]NWK78149.1 hypothetical protein [Aquitalea sp. LB_tupeE]
MQKVAEVFGLAVSGPFFGTERLQFFGVLAHHLAQQGAGLFLEPFGAGFCSVGGSALLIEQGSLGLPVLAVAQVVGHGGFGVGQLCGQRGVHH